MKKSALLWTGGKDSYLAYLRSIKQEMIIEKFVTFIPKGECTFQAHPQNELKEVASELGYDVLFLEIEEPFFESYQQQLLYLRDHYHINSVITGDIDIVEDYPNWIEECCKSIGLGVLRPLWKESREIIMKELVNQKFKVMISWINHPQIPPEWKGKIIDVELLKKLTLLSKEYNFDLCGENGEYHTMVTVSE